VRCRVGSLPGMTTSPPERATAASLVGLGAFQLALALGAPWGRAAYGGVRAGTLPTHLRVISGVAAGGYGTGALLVLRGTGSSRARARGFTAVSGFMALGAFANGASRSPLERAVWTPFAVTTSVLAWRARRHTEAASEVSVS
jgi:hypothetical protein